MDLQAILIEAEIIAREAGDLLREGFGQEIKVSNKSNAGDWVTQFDVAAEALIVSRLTVVFPDFGIIGEEGTQRNGRNGRCWYIDPLDGTNNFAHHLPVFCVSLALYEGNQPMLAVVYDPMRDECFTAIHRQGAYLSQGQNRRRLQVSQSQELVYCLLGTGYPYDKHYSEINNITQTTVFLKRIQGLRRGGSAALDLAYVAAGRLDGFWEFKLKSWDMAAGWLLITEAGGQVTAMDGQPLQIAPSLEIVASNGRIHFAMLDTLAETMNLELAI
jgi:myo-inositol-1(or 4)-monophosphatase